MAIIRSLAVGKARKSAGNLTYQTVKGRTIAREKPAFVANPNTPLQQEQRGKMRNLVAAWRAWFSSLKPYFTVIDGYGSAYNQFVKMNMPFAEDFIAYPDTGRVGFSKAYFSNGKYPQRSLETSDAEGNIMVAVNDIQLRQEAEAGDKFIIITHGILGGNPVIREKVIESAEIEGIRAGVAIDTLVKEDIENVIGVIFYSSKHRTSSTLFFEL